MSGEYIIGSDGSLEHYEDTYKVEAADIERAEHLVSAMLQAKAKIEVEFFRLGSVLDEFERNKYYLARGFPSFKTWAESPELNIGYRTAHNLIRIVREALPILQRAGKMEQLPSLSTMYDLLPVLSDENGEEKFLQAIDEVQGLTTRDAKDAIKNVRGIESSHEDRMPIVFSAQVERGETLHRVRIYCSDGVDTYEVTASGPLLIKPRDWPRWEERFGRFLQIT